MAVLGRRRSGGGSLKSLFTNSSIFACVTFPFVLFLLLSCFAGHASAAGSAVLGIDVGTEFLKAALVKPGIPLEIVLTKDSKRKESAAVAFKPTREKDAPFPERFYGGDALALAARYPDDVYINLKTLLGVTFDDDARSKELVETYRRRFPALRLETAPGDRGTVGFRSGKLGETEGKDAFLLEELLAMQLKQLKANADALAGKGSDVRDAVITYPAFYTAQEKRSLELAAQLAGLNVEGLISDGLAVALNFATSRTFPSVSEGQQPEYHVVYDMGAGSTTATVLRFQSRAVKDVGRFNKTIQEVQVIGTGWDKTLGGDSLNELIVDDMVEALIEHKPLKGQASTSDVKAHGKTMARIWKDAERVRQILSANTETGSSAEGLYHDDVNFKYKVTRSKFEELAKDHASRVGKPLEQALSAAGLQLSDVESIILHGGAMRTPFVQKELEKICGSSAKLRTSVNADESAVFGAAFRGAALSPSFLVKDIRASDSANYAVLLKWNSDSKERKQKIFTPNSLVGPEKQVTMKNLEDFDFRFYQQVSGKGDDAAIDLPVLAVQTQNLTASVAKLTEEFGCAAANITTKFSIRLSQIDGLPEVLGGAVSCEVQEEKWGSVVEDVKGFFGLGSKKGEQEPLGEELEPTESITLEAEEPQVTTTASTESSTSTVSVRESKRTGSQMKTESIPIALTTSELGVPSPSVAELARIRARLAAFDASDHERILREEALNELESFIYLSRDLVYDEDFVKAFKEGQLAVLNEKVAAASDWLATEGDHAKRTQFLEQLQALKELVHPPLRRKMENASRPARIQALQDVLKSARTLAGLMEAHIKNDEEIFASDASKSSASSSESAQSGTSTASAAESEYSSSSSSSSSSSPSPSPSADPFDDLDDDPYSSSSSKTTTSETAKPTGPKYAIFQPSDLATLKKTYEAVTTWFETQSALQQELTESDDPALPIMEIDVRLRELERTITRIYEKLGAGPKSGGSGKGSGSTADDRSKKSGSKKEKSKKNKEKKKTDADAKAKASSSATATATAGAKDEL